MRLPRMSARILGAALIVSGTLSAPAVAAPLRADAGLSKAAPAVTESVQYRRWGGRGYGYHHHHRGGGGAGALIGGLAAGAIIGGAIAASQAQAAAQQNAAYCAQRYRSYDPASGTYLNRDGNRYPCP